MMIKVAIVNFFKADATILAVGSLLKQRVAFDLDVTVVDNSCCSRQAATLRDAFNDSVVDLHISTENLGYVEGCSVAVGSSQFNFLLLMNPDICFTKEDDLQTLVSKFQVFPSMGVLGCKQLNPDHSIEPVVRNFASIGTLIARRTFLKRFFRKAVDDYENLDFNYEVESEVPWLQSSFMLLRGDAYEQLGGLDRRFWLFMSDPDICLRAWRNGWKVLYTPDVAVFADGVRCSAGSWTSVFSSRAMRAHIIDALKFDLKYFNDLYLSRRSFPIK